MYSFLQVPGVSPQEPPRRVRAGCKALEQFQSAAQPGQAALVGSAPVVPLLGGKSAEEGGLGQTTVNRRSLGQTAVNVTMTG